MKFDWENEKEKDGSKRSEKTGVRLRRDKKIRDDRKNYQGNCRILLCP